jgi:predicted metal-dependent hydrolase
MKSAISKTTSSNVSSEIIFYAGEVARPLMIRRVASARRMRLSVDPRDGAVRLTLPRRASEAKARAWVEQQRAWIEQQLGLLPQPRPIAPGAVIPFRGEDLPIDWSRDHPRTPHLDDGRLLVGGPIEGMPRRVLTWLKREALRVLEAETREIAAKAGVTVGRVGIGDPRARWGSCTSSGDIRYAWRLILAPRHVLTATVAHEVAHRLHMDHSPAFRAAEARLLGSSTAPARAWLKQHGASLYWVG